MQPGKAEQSGNSASYKLSYSIALKRLPDRVSLHFKVHPVERWHRQTYCWLLKEIRRPLAEFNVFENNTHTNSTHTHTPTQSDTVTPNVTPVASAVICHTLPDLCADSVWGCVCILIIYALAKTKEIQFNFPTTPSAPAAGNGSSCPQKSPQ